MIYYLDVLGTFKNHSLVKWANYWWRMRFEVCAKNLQYVEFLSRLFSSSAIFFSIKYLKIEWSIKCWFLEFWIDMNNKSVFMVGNHDLCSQCLLCSRYCFRGSLDGYYTITSTRRKCSFLRYLNSCTAELLDVHNTLSRWTNNSTYDTFIDFQLNLVDLQWQWYEMRLY